MLNELRHLWDVAADTPLVSTDEYIGAYRQGRCTGAGRPYLIKGSPWCWFRRLLRRLGRDPRNVYGWWMTRPDVPEAPDD